MTADSSTVRWVAGKGGWPDGKGGWPAGKGVIVLVKQTKGNESQDFPMG